MQHIDSEWWHFTLRNEPISSRLAASNGVSSGSITPATNVSLFNTRHARFFNFVHKECNVTTFFGIIQVFC